tara:strand:- start:370 stop:975 length:606 start_codon:yes stop_codon:yes gene_type:complete
MVKKLLHVGCGRLTKANTTPEFNTDKWSEIRVDIDESVNPDIVASLTDMSAVESSSYDAVYSSHNIEHLFAHEVPLALKEMLRVLNDDGFLVITCPDLKSVCAQVAEGNLTEPLYQSGMGPISAIDILYGHRTSIQDGNHYMAHKIGFTSKVLHSTLLGSGFVNAVVMENASQYVLWGIATKKKHQDPDILVEDLKKHAIR